MKRFRVGIIGCGSIFPMHSVSVVQQVNAELVAVCDIKEDRAKQRAEEYNCAYYLDYQEMIDKENLDVVHICTPHYLHAPMAVYAAEKGVHILTEKPMAIELADAYAMIEAAENSGVVLGVIFQNRYNPGSKLIKEVLDSGELGRLLSCKLSVTWKRTDEYYSLSDWKGTWELEGGGVVIDQAIHTPEEIERYCEQGPAKMTADSGVVRLNNGRELRADPDPNEFFNYGAVKQYWGVSHIKQITNFYQALAQGVEPDITGRDAVKTQELVCAIYQSGKQRTRVVL